MTPEAVIAGRAQWALVHGDACALYENFRTNSVDHVITDPPYRRALYENFRTNSRVRSPKFRVSGVIVSSEAYQALASLKIGALEDVLDSSAPAFLRIARRWIVVFHDAESGHLWRAPFGESYVRAGVWVKPNPVPQISGDRPGQGFESMTIAHRPGRKRWNAGGKPAVWRHVALQSNYLERRGNPHPCPKPLSLMRELIEQFTDPGDVVLDPFAGSGSTGVACLQLGRRFIGVERDAKFARYATYRMRTCAV